jgi:DNA-binding transcriptional MerR regulator
MKRRGNRRYYQRHEVLLIRRIRDLLYEQGFTISGARNRLADGAGAANQGRIEHVAGSEGETALREGSDEAAAATASVQVAAPTVSPSDVRGELIAIRALLTL